MLKGLFWISVVGVLFSYFLYPLLLRISPRRPGATNDHLPSRVPPRVSLIVTAHNEEARIREKIDNCLKLTYPDLELIVASDASSDGTDQIVSEYSGQGVVLARAEERKGKEHAQLQAIKAASGEILIFSDVATSIPEDAIERMVRYFDDPAVGAVSSEDRFVSRDGSVAGEGAYVRYECGYEALSPTVRGWLASVDLSSLPGVKSAMKIGIFTPRVISTRLLTAPGKGLWR